MLDGAVPPEFLNKRTIGSAWELLKKIPDYSVDLVLTDPPYDFTFGRQLDYQREFERVTRGQVIVFCSPQNVWPSVGLKKVQELFWIKPISTKNTSRHYSRFVEIIRVMGVGKWNSGRHWSQYTNVFTDLVDDSKLHPYRKPPSLIERLVLNHSDEGDLILDPFAGSGVVGDVCQRLGRNHISFEIEG